jgi:hypothetical protein
MKTSLPCWRGLLLGLGLMLAGLGCGPGNGEEGEVSGKVLFKDQPLPSGTVKFLGADGKTISSAIATDGTYRVRKVAVGLAQITVDSHPRVPYGLQLEKQKAVPIPRDYSDPKKSRLTCEVKPGEQTFNIELRPSRSP